MSEKFTDLENVFDINNVFEIDPEANVMRGGAFLKIIETIRQEVVSNINNEVENLLQYESINLKKLHPQTDDSLTYEIKTLSAENNQLVWKNQKIRFRLAIEACSEESSIADFKSPLDDIRQSIQNPSEES